MSTVDRLDQIVADLADMRVSLATTAADVRHIGESLPALHDRVSALEVWRWRAAGALGLMVVVGIPIVGVMSR